MDFKNTSLVLIILTFCANCTFSLNSTINSTTLLPTCSGYIDTRNVTDAEKGNSIIIPEDRHSGVFMGNDPAVVKTVSINFQTQANQTLKCAEENAEMRKITLKFKLERTYTGRGRNFENVTKESVEAHAHSYFTASGYFYDYVTRNYYKPNGDYCVDSYSEHEISLKVCAVSENCTSFAMPNTWCLPKCCALDEVLIYWKRQCVRINETDGITPWFPPIYQSAQHLNKQLTDVTNKTIFHHAKFPLNCNALNYSDGSVKQYPLYKRFSASAITHPVTAEFHRKDHVKLLAPTNDKNGRIQVMVLYDASRRWKVMDNWNHFCVEGYHMYKPKGQFTPPYKGDTDNFVILYCDNDFEEENSQSVAKFWIYSLTSILAICFLFATMVIYAILWEKQNLHGLTILSYTATNFFGNVFLLSAHLVSFLPESVHKSIGLYKREGLCYGIAVLAHYFTLSSYAWLTTLNVDLYLTFHSIRVRSNVKKWGRFIIYSVAAWVLPFMLVIAFIIVNEVYSDPTTLVPIPDYAFFTCFVSPDFRGEYVYAPMAILLGINCLLIALTMKIFLEARCHMTKAFSGSNTNQYSAKLFVKLFVVMGGTSLVDFLTWYYNAKFKPWPIVALETTSYLFTPFILFVLFCLNNRTVSQLREKYPAVIDKLQPLLNIIVRLDGRPEHSRSGSARKSSFGGRMGRHDSGTETISMKTVSLSRSRSNSNA